MAMSSEFCLILCILTVTTQILVFEIVQTYFESDFSDAHARSTKLTLATFGLCLVFQYVLKRYGLKSWKGRVLLVVLGALVVAGVVTALVLLLRPENAGYTLGAVTANGHECAAIGRDVLAAGGSAADAAIATVFCEGVACVQSAGLGGGFVATLWARESGAGDGAPRIAVSLNAREVAPLATTNDMYQEGNISSTVGGLAVAVPGELRGYGALHARFGRLPWASLVKPAADLARTGARVTEYFARVLITYRERILAQPSLSEVFVNPATGDVWLEGQHIPQPRLAETLDIIAEEGPEAMHNGSLTSTFVADIQSFDGIITVEDMNSYTPHWEEPVTVTLDDTKTLYSSPLPASGPVLAFILNMISGWVGGEDAPVGSTTFWHRSVEAFKYAYAKRTSLGDPNFIQNINEHVVNLTNPDMARQYRLLIEDDRTYSDWRHYGAEFANVEDHGTAHVSVVSPDGEAVAITSTINFILGSLRRSTSTGIVLNNEMDDFSIPGVTSLYGMPPSPANFPAPGKRPMSSMCPTVVVNSAGDPILAVGAAGGTKITTQVALVVLKHLLLGVSLEDAVDNPRAHHQLLPMEIEHEAGFDEKVIEELHAIGHNTTQSISTSGFAAVTVVSVDAAGRVWPLSDHRRYGSVAGL